MSRHQPSGGVLVIGEALVDVIAADRERTRVYPGGSPLNVAVGLRRLGLPTRLHTQFGFDPYGDLIAAHLAANDVDVTPNARGMGPTSVAHARILPDGSAEYDFRVRWDPQPLDVEPSKAVAVHTGSVAALLSPGASVVRNALVRLRTSATLSYDPNVRPQLMGDPTTALDQILPIVAGADIVKASDEDIAWLYPGVDHTHVARDWLTLGPSIVAVTRGAAGAHAVTRAGVVDVAARTTQVADTVGAGDSFMAGLLAALSDLGLLGRNRAPALNTIDLPATKTVIEFAIRCAAVTVSRHGADLPRRDDLAAT